MEVDLVFSPVFQDQHQLCLIVMSTQRIDIYTAVKKLTVNRMKVPSQCILARFMRHKNVSFIASKVLLQINTKLGGQTWDLRLPKVSDLVH